MLLGSFIPRTDFSQLLHLADMVEHYKLHQEEAQLAGLDFGIVDFMYIHFINPDEHHDEAHDHHEQLPFYTFSSIDLDYFRQINFLIQPQQIPTTLISKHSFYYHCLYTEGFLQLLMRPPAVG